MILDNILNTLTSVATKAYGELDRVYLIDFGSILESSKDPFIFVTSLVTNVLTEVLGNKGSSAGYITSLASQITTTLMNQVFDLDVKMWWYRFRINPSTASITRRSFSKCSSRRSNRSKSSCRINFFIFIFIFLTSILLQ